MRWGIKAKFGGWVVSIGLLGQVESHCPRQLDSKAGQHKKTPIRLRRFRPPFAPPPLSQLPFTV